MRPIIHFDIDDIFSLCDSYDGVDNIDPNDAQKVCLVATIPAHHKASILLFKKIVRLNGHVIISQYEQDDDLIIETDIPFDE
jgi:hypothetical protein